ncbi:MAG: sterol desaturase family protein [Phaeodactylibacter sp.]|nr:sterol desaturase family protein [Phaeodactylibacter sp.]MCB9291611.1 sterol desaturase family protein [Lewinellaceae bacterium]
MEAYASVLNYAIPFFMSLLLLEALAAWLKGEEVLRSMDTLSSLSSGLTNVIKDVLGLTVVVVSYGWFVDHVALLEIRPTWMAYTLAFIGLDFAGYWVHRLSHRVNIFWNRHIIHHSSEEYNLGCALRQSISGFISITVFFLVPIAFLGVPAEVVGVVAPLHLFAQYWYHTRLIGKMGFLEKIIVTPSHHRVHHAINPEYLDKNLSQIFIVWDKIFGTFQEELDEVPPVYGVTRPVRTWNPFLINFMHLWLLVKDAWRTKSWKDKLKIWFMPTGWRPADIAGKYPVPSIRNVYDFEKYAPTLSRKLQAWAWAQFVFTFMLMMYLFNNLADIGFQQALVYGAFLFLSIFSFTMLMDKNPHAWWVELSRSIAGLVLIYIQGDWFGLAGAWPAGIYLLTAYFIFSPALTSAFVVYEVLPAAQGLQRAG